MGGVAIIQAERAGRLRWLAQWNRKWQALHFVGGHKLAEESFRECVIREVTEELGLSAAGEFHVADDPLARVSYIAHSQSAREDTLYSLELFEVAIHSPAECKVDSNSMNRWLTAGEIREQRCDDGTAVSATMERLLQQTGLLPD